MGEVQSGHGQNVVSQTPPSPSISDSEKAFHPLPKCFFYSKAGYEQVMMMIAKAKSPWPDVETGNMMNMVMAMMIMMMRISAVFCRH